MDADKIHGMLVRATNRSLEEEARKQLPPDKEDAADAKYAAHTADLIEELYHLAWEQRTSTNYVASKAEIHPYRTHKQGFLFSNRRRLAVVQRSRLRREENKCEVLSWPYPQPITNHLDINFEFHVLEDMIRRAFRSFTAPRNRVDRGILEWKGARGVNLLFTHEDARKLESGTKQTIKPTNAASSLGPSSVGKISPRDLFRYAYCRQHDQLQLRRHSHGHREFHSLEIKPNTKRSGARIAKRTAKRTAKRSVKRVVKQTVLVDRSRSNWYSIRADRQAFAFVQKHSETDDLLYQSPEVVAQIIDALSRIVDDDPITWKLACNDIRSLLGWLGLPFDDKRARIKTLSAKAATLLWTFLEHEGRLPWGFSLIPDYNLFNRPFFFHLVERRVYRKLPFPCHFKLPRRREKLKGSKLSNQDSYEFIMECLVQWALRHEPALTSEEQRLDETFRFASLPKKILPRDLYYQHGNRTREKLGKKEKLNADDVGDLFLLSLKWPRLRAEIKHWYWNRWMKAQFHVWVYGLRLWKRIAPRCFCLDALQLLTDDSRERVAEETRAMVAKWFERKQRGSFEHDTDLVFHKACLAMEKTLDSQSEKSKVILEAATFSHSVVANLINKPKEENWKTKKGKQNEVEERHVPLHDPEECKSWVILDAEMQSSKRTGPVWPGDIWVL